MCPNSVDPMQGISLQYLEIVSPASAESGPPAKITYSIFESALSACGVLLMSCSRDGGMTAPRGRSVDSASSTESMSGLEE